MSRIVLGLLVIVAALACETAPVEAPQGDDVDELSLIGPEIASRFDVEDEWSLSPVVAAEDGANRVALMATLADGAALPRVRVRGLDGDQVGPWHEASWTFAELGRLAGFGPLDEVWLEVQIAVPSEAIDQLARVTFSPAFVDEGALEVAIGEAEQGLRGELAFIGVQPRSAWGARASRCSTRDGSFSRMALHHTAARAGSNVELSLRQAQSYHMDGRGYCDVAYHFAVSQDGRVFELRPLPFRGGHTRNNNTGNIGIVFAGCFDPACGNEQPTGALIDAGAGIVRALHLLYGITINADRVRGHRDHSYAATACPGANLYPRLGDIRARAAAGNAPPAPPTPPPPNGCGIMGPGAALARGAAMQSCDGRLNLVHQGDGNVVLYQAGDALWNSGTHGRATGTFVMQGDGNLVIYSPWGAPIWSTGTHGNHNAFLRVQDDGNLVVYRGGSAIWSTGTQATSAPPPAAPAPPPPAAPPPPPPAPAACGGLAAGAALAPGQSVLSCDGRFNFVHQTDGNVVLYQGGSPRWFTGTHGRATSNFVMQGDGNLVLYSGAVPLWSTGTHGQPGSRLAIQDDGNVVLYRGGNALWNTGTCCH